MRYQILYGRLLLTMLMLLGIGCAYADYSFKVNYCVEVTYPPASTENYSFDYTSAYDLSTNLRKLTITVESNSAVAFYCESAGSVIVSGDARLEMNVTNIYSLGGYTGIHWSLPPLGVGPVTVYTQTRTDDMLVCPAKTICHDGDKDDYSFDSGDTLYIIYVIE